MAVSWEDRAIVLSVRRHGEHDAITTVFGAERGRFSGMVKGGAGRRNRGLLQPGNLLQVSWRARLEDQLGTMTCEPQRMIAGDTLGDRRGLAALSAMCAMLEACLPEREPHPGLFEDSLAALSAFASTESPSLYARWELALLREIGFGLDLSACGVTGVTEGLVFVSPRSGRAVSREGAGSYAERLLRLPSFLLADAIAPTITETEIDEALRLTGHFFEAHVFAPHDRRVPAARTRFVDLAKS